MQRKMAEYADRAIKFAEDLGPRGSAWRPAARERSLGVGLAERSRSSVSYA